jgi:hypothetical protein
MTTNDLTYESKQYKYHCEDILKVPVLRILQSLISCVKEENAQAKVQDQARIVYDLFCDQRSFVFLLEIKEASSSSLVLFHDL